MRTGGDERLKVNRYTYRGSNSFIFIFVSHLTWGQFLKKGICSHRSKFFPLRVDPTLKGLHCPEKRAGSHKKLSPFVKMIENYGGVHIHLNIYLFNAEDKWIYT